MRDWPAIGLPPLGFQVPGLVNTDKNLLVVEIHIVKPPYLIEFGKAYLDHSPEHTPEVMADWIDSMKELWEDRWPKVQSLLSALRLYGIHYLDAKPGNIMFSDDTN